MSNIHKIVNTTTFLNDELYFTIDENSPKLPTDKHGRTLFVGDTIRILHNNRISKIMSLTHTVHNLWIISLDIDDGDFLLPQNKDDIVKLVMR